MENTRYRTKIRDMYLIDEFFFSSSIQEENALKNFVKNSKLSKKSKIRGVRRDVIFDMTEMKRIFQRDSLVTKVLRR